MGNTRSRLVFSSLVVIKLMMFSDVHRLSTAELSHETRGNKRAFILTGCNA